MDLPPVMRHPRRRAGDPAAGCTCVHRAGQRGSALVVTLLLSLLILVLGLALLGTAELERHLGAYHASRIEALYIGEAGIHRALYELNQDPFWRGNGSSADPAFLPGDDGIGRARSDVRVTGWEDDPSLEAVHPYAVRIRSNAFGYGKAARSVLVIAAPEIVVLPILDFAAFACGDIHLLAHAGNRIYEGDVFTDGNLVLDRPAEVEEADVHARGNVRFDGQGSVMNGTVNANGHIQTLSTTVPTIVGDANAGGSRADPAKVTGRSLGNVSPLPVKDLCARLGDDTFAITKPMMADWRSRPDKTIWGDAELPRDQGELGDPIEGITHITGDLLVTGDTTYRGNGILLVDGNIIVTAGLTRQDATSGDTLLLVAEGDIEIPTPGTLEADAFFYTTGDFLLRDGGTVQIQGGVAAWGDIEALGGTLDVEYLAPTNPEVQRPSEYGMLSWREVRN